MTIITNLQKHKHCKHHEISDEPEVYLDDVHKRDCVHLFIFETITFIFIM